MSACGGASGESSGLSQFSLFLSLLLSISLPPGIHGVAGYFAPALRADLGFAASPTLEATFAAKSYGVRVLAPSWHIRIIHNRMRKAREKSS